MESFKTIFAKITKKQSMEFGQVAVLISTFLALYLKDYDFVIAAFILSFFTITVPYIFYPLAVCWFGVSRILSAISSGILMGFVFIFIVIPVGLSRKLLGKDSLKLKQFKKNKESVMVTRDHLYTAEDLLHTF
jgi:hypothetical protein